MNIHLDNRGGIRRIYAISVSSILRIRHNWNDGTVTPELLPDHTVIEIPCFAGNTYRHTEEQSLAAHGNLYSVKIEGVIPDGMISDHDVSVLQCGEWLVIHQAVNGRILLSGTRSIPLRFSGASDTGAAPGDMAGRRFTFSALESRPSHECYVADMTSI